MASASVNRVILIGNLGRDPEVRYASSGSAICNLALATSRQWKDKTTGEWQEETEWHRVVLYERLAEVAGEYLRKGSSCYIEGRLRTRKWQDKDGIDRYTTEIIAEQMKMLGGRGEGDAQPQEHSKYADTKGKAQPKQAHQQGNSGFDDMDDDIPF